MIEQNNNEEETIDIWDYIHLLWNKKLLILVISSVVVILGLFISFMTPHSFTASCKVRLKQAYESQAVEVYNKRYFANQFWLSTELEVIKSKEVIRELVENTKINGVDLVTYYITKPQASLAQNICKVFGTTPTQLRELLFGWLPKDKSVPKVKLSPKEFEEYRLMQVVGLVQSMVNVDIAKDSSVVNIFVTSYLNPEEAKIIANALPKAYERFKIKDKMKGINQGLDAIRSQVAEKLEKVNVLRKKLSIIRKKYNITISHEEPIKEIDPEAFSRIKTTLMNARIDMLLQQKTWEKIEEMNDSELSEAFGVLMDDSMGYLQLKNDLNSATVQFKLLKIDFGESHPKVKRAKVELEELTKQMKIRIAGIKSAMKLRYEKSVTKYEGVKLEYDQLASELSGKRSMHIQEFNAVASELSFAKERLISIRKSLSEKEVNQRLPQSVIELISLARTPRFRSSPKHVKALAVSVFLGLALAVGLVFLMDFLDCSLKSITQVENVTGMEVIATIPFLSKKDLKSGRLFVDVLNAMDIVTDKKSKIFSIHSSMPGEGKSTVCVKTAIESARAGNKVLVIDMDVRRPMVHNILDVELSGGVAETVEAHSVEGLSLLVKETKYNGLSVLTAGSYSNGPSLTSKLMQCIIDEFRDEYDFVILDCPPVTVVNESLIMANASDEIFLIIRPNYSKTQLVSRAVSMLKGLDCHVAGVVINQVPAKSSINYTNKLYNKYYS